MASKLGNRCISWYVKIVVILLLLLPVSTAHPGRKNKDGCHTCRTNCENWGLEYEEYHCHTSNQEGDSEGNKDDGGVIELICGDKECDPKEDCSSCPEDCGECQEIEKSSIKSTAQSKEDAKVNLDISNERNLSTSFEKVSSPGQSEGAEEVDSEKILNSPEIIGMTVYESRDAKAGKSAIFFLTAALILIVIALLIAMFKNEQRNKNKDNT